MKLKPRSFIIDVPLYPAEILVTIGLARPEFERAVKRWKTPSDRDKLALMESSPEFDAGNGHGTDAFVNRLDGTGIMILSMEKVPHNAEGFGILAHEVFHAVEYIAEHVGLKHCDGSSEAFAYLITYITTKIYERL